MTDKLQAAAQQALEALESLFSGQADHERAKRCSDAITTLRTALAEQPAEQAPVAQRWQPIETAPKGRIVLVYYKNSLGNGRTMRARYYLPETLDSDTTESGWADEGWYEESEAYEYLMPLEHDPTHWMPLPAGPDTAPQPANPAEQEPWYPGHPPFPQDQEWFIAETVYGDRVCLRSLDEGREHKGSYAFTTADGTYLKAEVVRRWMQFPDCEYLPPSAPEAPQPTKREPLAWEGGEGWESLAWELCADENGEEACNELIWEGGPIPEPWGDRWMKYEDEAKRLIALVHKHTAPQPTKQPLTDEEIDAIRLSVGYAAGLDRFVSIARAIEAAHGITKE